MPPTCFACATPARRSPFLAALPVAVLALGCSGDDGARTTGDSATSGVATVGTATAGTASGSTTAGATDTDTAGTASGTTGGCPPERMCDGGVCCPEGKVCSVGTCVTDCGGEPACGPDEVCCQGAEICHAGTCLVPGADCDTAACATQQASCPEDQVCDPSLGKCIPKVANASCTFTPPPQTFEPVPRFSWGERRVRSCMDESDCQTAEVCMGGTCMVTWTHVDIAMDDLPEYKQVTSVPMVADLDADCVPEIVFNAYKNSAFYSDGVLRAIRGDTGEKVWTVSDPAYRTDSTSNPALGDITGDGLPDVVVQGEGKYLVAIDSSGTPLWQSDPFTFPSRSGSASIANMDGEGLPEIVFGSAVYDAAGTRLWEGSQGSGHNAIGPISCVADLTGDGRPEVVGGRTAYTFTGTVAGGDFTGQILWDTNYTDGYCGVADMDTDGDPDVVLVSAGAVQVLEGATGAQMATLAIPGGGHGGAPNIADFDGDGAPEIGTAGGSNYVVIDFTPPATLAVLWQAPTEDDSSSRTGSSVFDFDGDGRAEVVYGDEEYLRIYPGVEPDCDLNPPGPACDGIMTDAEVLFRDLNSSRTRSEYPVIADVDGDFKAELVFATNNEAGFLDPNLLGDAGIEVWEDALDNWMPTRPIWNQHTYHVENVADDGTIPATEGPNWTTHNSYRRNTQGEVENCAPDLVPFDLQSDGAACPDLNLSVWVKNQGCLGVGPGVQVSFYEQTAGLLGTATTQGPIVPGGAEKLSISVPAPGPGPFSVWVVVDDDGMGGGAFNECVEDNNAHDPLEACKPVG